MFPFEHSIFSTSTMLQSFSVLVSMVGAYLFCNIIIKILNFSLKEFVKSNKVSDYLETLLFPLLWGLILWTFVAVSIEFQLDLWITRTAAVLITSWAITRFISLFDFQKNHIKLAHLLVYTIASLEIFGLLHHVFGIMDSIGFTIGELNITLLSVLKGGITFAFFLWGTIILSRRIETELKGSVKIEPSLQTLFTKLIRVSLIAFSVLIALSSVGLDLSAFAVFGGAIGVGIGFGLQKVVSNLVCGIILLLDRSVKPGDVIAIDQGKSYGEINRLGARCVSVRTRSGKEHLIPNEDFITHKSENWSHSDSLLRLGLPIRAGLESDVPLVMDLLIEAANDVDRVLKNPLPGVRLKGFSDSAIEFELRVWINDPQRGLSKVKSDLYVNIWSLFKQNRITIPHQQQDVNFRRTEDSLQTISQILDERFTPIPS